MWPTAPLPDKRGGVSVGRLHCPGTKLQEIQWSRSPDQNQLIIDTGDLMSGADDAQEIRCRVFLDKISKV